MTTTQHSELVVVQGLRVEDRSGRAVLHDASLSMSYGDRLGVVGESGSGKTTLALGLLGHFRPDLIQTAGSIRVADREVLSASPRDMREYRSTVVSYLGQDPVAALTPNMRVADQVRELLRGDSSIGVVSARLESVGLPGDRDFLRRYSHELSGGQVQRVAIARALAPDPTLLILDEPTSALDLVTRRVIMGEIERQVDRLGISLIMISHDLGMVARVANRILVLREGIIVEQGAATATLTNPHHSYTRELLAAADGKARDSSVNGAAHPTGNPTLTARGLVASYGRGKRHNQVIHEVDLDIEPGECLAMIGMSGAGKSTVARCLLGLHETDSGSVAIAGSHLAPRVQDRSVSDRRSIQLVPQDPRGSLNPRRRINDTLRNSVRSMRGLGRGEADAEVRSLMERVRLSPSLLSRFPGELSGGERQRVAIARALAAEPRLLVCDEVTSALDVSVEASILDLIDELRREWGLSVLLIAHDLRVVRRIADRVIMLDEGRVCESGRLTQLFAAPQQELTRTILEADRSVSETMLQRLR